MIDLSQYLGVFLFFGIGVVFICSIFLVNYLVRERGDDPLRKTIYECGMEPIGSSFVSPNIRFYVYALIFVVFDVEVVFVIPWAVKFLDLGWAGFNAMLIFLGILTLGFVYEWKAGALKWE